MGIGDQNDLRIRLEAGQFGVARHDLGELVGARSLHLAVLQQQDPSGFIVPEGPDEENRPVTPGAELAWHNTLRILRQCIYVCDQIFLDERAHKVIIRPFHGGVRSVHEPVDVLADRKVGVMSRVAAPEKHRSAVQQFLDRRLGFGPGVFQRWSRPFDPLDRGVQFLVGELSSDLSSRRTEENTSYVGEQKMIHTGFILRE
ncbi:hypothetical protein L1I79_36380 [Strepomyces sp. STD 3.1]|nr:hypothetical protein [Streptomyces sp. STD 3.1]